MRRGGSRYCCRQVLLGFLEPPVNFNLWLQISRQPTRRSLCREALHRILGCMIVQKTVTVQVCCAMSCSRSRRITPITWLTCKSPRTLSACSCSRRFTADPRTPVQESCLALFKLKVFFSPCPCNNCATQCATTRFIWNYSTESGRLKCAPSPSCSLQRA